VHFQDVEPDFNRPWNEIGVRFTSVVVLGSSGQASLILEGGTLFRNGVVLKILGFNSVERDDVASGPDGIRLSVSYEDKEQEVISYKFGRSDRVPWVHPFGARSINGRFEFESWISPRPPGHLWITSEWSEFDIPNSRKEIVLPEQPPPSVSLWNPNTDSGDPDL
jgi:hypothetical protein